ncbi:MAG: zinc-binding dehydrogenase [Hyphomicrobiales bacterium]|nr:zinc-binding dehydrogenase [Hyphomicrobiales bacterium]MCC2113707.1 zinc-binding dehydrogenase [Hyphomicrobiales bacterium]
MALQYARKMGFKVVAVGRGEDIAADAVRLGAHVYIDATTQDAAKALNSMGGAQAIVTTVGKGDVVSPLVAGLAPGGRLVVLAPGKEPLALAAGALVAGERSVIGSITGSPFENEKTLNFSVLAGVRPLIEPMPLERAPEAIRRLRAGEAKFRIVLTMEKPNDAT